MSQSFSVRTISELSVCPIHSSIICICTYYNPQCIEHPNDAVIDLSDPHILHQFAEFVRSLSTTQRKAIWQQNVCPDQPSQAQYDNILTFLTMLYGQAQFPEEHKSLISKLKQFITSTLFINIKNYIQFRFYPLRQHDFVNNEEYFAAMIEEYAKTQIAIQANDMQHFVHLIAPSDSSIQSLSAAPIPNDKHLHIQSLDSMTFDYDTLMMTKLETKMNKMIAAKFGQIDEKLNHLQNEVEAIKHWMNEYDDAKEEKSEEMMAQIDMIKNEMQKMKMSQQYKTKRHAQSKSSRAAHDKMSKNVYMLSMKQKNEQKEKLKQWLEGIDGLNDTADAILKLFVDNGVNDVNLMKYVKMNDLTLLGISIPDRVKIMQSIQRLKYRESLKQNETEIIYKSASL